MKTAAIPNGAGHNNGNSAYGRVSRREFLSSFQELCDLFAESSDFHHNRSAVSSGQRPVDLNPNQIARLQDALEILKTTQQLIPGIPDLSRAIVQINKRLNAEHDLPQIKKTEIWKMKFDTPLNAIAFSPDGKIIAAGSRDMMVSLVSVRNGSELETVKLTSGWPNCLAFSPESRTLAVGTNNGIDYYDLSDILSRNRLEYVGHAEMDGAVYSLAFSPDGRTLAAGCSHQHVCGVDVKTDDTVFVREGLPGEPTSVAMSSGGLLAVGLDGLDRSEKLRSGYENVDLGRVHLLNAKDGKDSVPGFVFASAVNDVAFAPKGDVIAVACGDRHPYEIEHDGKIQTYPNLRNALYWVAYPNEKTLVTGGLSPNISYLSRATKQLMAQQEVNGNARAVSFNPRNGKKLAVACDTNHYDGEEVPPGNLHLYHSLL